MSEPSKQLNTTVDVDLVAAQFDALDSDTHRKALLEAIRAREVKVLVDRKPSARSVLALRLVV